MSSLDLETELELRFPSARVQESAPRVGGVLQRAGCWVAGCVVVGPLLVSCFSPAEEVDPWWEELGVCPQPMCFRDSILLRLVQSLCAMELLLTWAARSLSSLPCSVDGHGGVRGRRATTLASTKDLLGLFVFFYFCKVFCVRWCGQLSPLYSSSRCLYWFSTVYNFDMV